MRKQTIKEKLQKQRGEIVAGKRTGQTHVSFMVPAALHRGLRRLALDRSEANGRHVSLSSLAAEAFELLLASERKREG